MQSRDCLLSLSNLYFEVEIKSFVASVFLSFSYSLKLGILLSTRTSRSSSSSSSSSSSPLSMDLPSPLITPFVYDHQQDPLLNQPFHDSPSPPAFLCPILFNPSLEDHGGASYDSEQLYRFQECGMYASDGGRSIPSPNSLSSMDKDSDHDFKLSILEENDKVCDDHAQGSASWTSSKMSLIMNYDQKQPSSSSNPDNIRVCSDCNTTKTPLWRSGPKGPKSLCNACGIRQRKARRAMVVATAGTSNTTLASTEVSSKPTKMQHKNKKSGKSQVVQCKKQCKLAPRRRKLGFEDFIINLSNNSAFHRVFPQDETEAAILLMALSCGLVSD